MWGYLGHIIENSYAFPQKTLPALLCFIVQVLQPVREGYLSSTDNTIYMSKNTVQFHYDIRETYTDGPYKRVTLKKKDSVQKGLFPNKNTKRIKTIIKNYGKEGVLQLLKYCDLDEKILKEYHIHPLKKEEVVEEEKVVHIYASPSVIKGEVPLTSLKDSHEERPVIQVTDSKEESLSEELYEVVQDQEVCDDYTPWIDSALYDPEDDPMDSYSHFSPVSEIESTLYENNTQWKDCFLIINTKIYEDTY